MKIITKQPVPQRVGKDEVARIDAETQAKAKKSKKVGAAKKPAKKTGVKSKKK